MKQQEIIEIVKTKGNIGCTTIEHYIDMPDKINGDYVQVVFFDDERGLAVYLVDEYEQGEFVDYEDYSHKEEIENYLLEL